MKVCLSLRFLFVAIWFGIPMEAVALLAITNAPSSQMAPVGGAITFTVGITSSSPVFVQWQRDGTNILGATRNTVSVTNLSTNDISSFQVVASNVSEVVTSAVATLSVHPQGLVPMGIGSFGGGNTFLTPTGFHSGFATYAYPTGASVTLHIKASNSWQIGSVDYDCPKGSNGFLTLCQKELIAMSVFPNFTNRDYTTQATDPRFFVVTYVPGPPRFIEQPHSQTLLPGTNATLTASVEGIDVRYQWYFGGILIAGATNNSLSFSNVSTDYAGPYQLLALNGAGQATSFVAQIIVVPSNDNFADRKVIVKTNFAVAVLTAGASREIGEPIHAGQGGASLWWSWTAPCTCPVSVNTIGSTFDTLLAVYTGAAFSNLVLVAQDDQSGGNDTSLVAFTATNGVVYSIAVDGFEGATGGAFLSLSVEQFRLAIFSSSLDNHKSIIVGGQANRPFAIDTSTNLSAWTVWQTNRTDSQGEAFLSISFPAEEPQRFFRAHAP